jgi:hypothetical protein
MYSNSPLGALAEIYDEYNSTIRCTLRSNNSPGSFKDAQSPSARTVIPQRSL